jgi:hypothetical protein
MHIAAAVFENSSGWCRLQGLRAFLQASLLFSMAGCNVLEAALLLLFHRSTKDHMTLLEQLQR